jgi:excisionase family DNA binding protein
MTSRERAPAARAQAEDRRAFTIKEFAARNGIGRDKVYGEIRQGRLRARKAGKLTLIFDVDEIAWRDALPVLELPAA